MENNLTPPPLEDSQELNKLREFYKSVAKLTLHHEDVGGYAVIMAYTLGKELEKIDPEWYNIKESDYEI
jgi:hypothetical protein